MSADIKNVLVRLHKKELLELAIIKKIHIPKNWSKSLIVKLLALNVSLDNIQKMKTKPLERNVGSDGVPAIIITNLMKQYEDVTAVDDLTLEIMEGELFSLLGPNGAGKTTTINIINGITKPTSGTAIISGFDVAENLDEIKRIVGFCPQEASV